MGTIDIGSFPKGGPYIPWRASTLGLAYNLAALDSEARNIKFKHFQKEMSPGYGVKVDYKSKRPVPLKPNSKEKTMPSAFKQKAFVRGKITNNTQSRNPRGYGKIQSKKYGKSNASAWWLWRSRAKKTTKSTPKSRYFKGYYKSKA